MKDYIQSTLGAIDARIAELQGLRDSLVHHFSADDGAVDTAPAPAVRRPAAKKAKPAPRARIRAGSTATGGMAAADDEAGAIRVGSVQHATLVAARKFADPFTAEQIAEATNADKSVASVTLGILVKKNLLEVVGKDGLKNTYRVKNG